MERKPYPAEERRVKMVLSAMPSKHFEGAVCIRRKIWNDYATPEERTVLDHRAERYLEALVRDGLAEKRDVDGKAVYRRKEGCR